MRTQATPRASFRVRGAWGQAVVGRAGRGRRVNGAASDVICCSGATDGSAGVFGVGEGVLGGLSPPGEATGRWQGQNYAIAAHRGHVWMLRSHKTASTVLLCGGVGRTVEIPSKMKY